ncbi:MAG: hypothetical protein ACMUEM_03385 [Flavobacteriales bacterium AspAUS03]
MQKITPPSPEIWPNIILILMESMSTDFMKRYGNNQKLTPTLDILNRKRASPLIDFLPQVHTQYEV